MLLKDLIDVVSNDQLLKVESLNVHIFTGTRNEFLRLLEKELKGIQLVPVKAIKSEVHLVLNVQFTLMKITLDYFVTFDLR